MKVSIRQGQWMAIAVLGLVAGSLGFWKGLDVLSQSSRAEKDPILENLKNRTHQGIEQFWIQVDQYKRLSAVPIEPLQKPVIAIAHFSGPGWALEKTWSPSTVSPRELELWKKEIQSRILSWGKAVEAQGPGLVRFRPEELAYREWLSFVFYNSLTKKIQVIAVNPQDAFGAVSPSPAGQNLRSYLMGTDGTVLAHSQAGYAGSKFTRAGIFKEAIEPTARGERREGTGDFEAIDGLPVQAAYARAGNLPLVWVIEQPKARAVVGTEFFVILARVGAVLLASAMLLTGILWMRRRREFSHVGAPNYDSGLPLPKSKAPAGADVVAVSPEEFFQSTKPEAPAESLFPEHLVQEELLASQHALRSMEEERRILADFDESIFDLRHPDVATEKLTRSVSQLCVSPTLFLVFQETLRAVQLRFDAGFSAGAAPVEMMVPIDPDFLGRLTEVAVSGDPEAQDQMRRMMSTYPAIAKIILARCGVAYFEAWPVFRYTPLGRAAGRPRLHGVLVVLQAGEVAYRRAPAVGRMIRSAALVYENSMSAQ